MLSFKIFCAEASFNVKAYGAWIDPKGKIHTIKTEMGHEDFINMNSKAGADRYEQGGLTMATGPSRFRSVFDEGWIRIIFDSMEVMSVEGTEKAIKKQFNVLWNAPSSVKVFGIDIIKKGKNVRSVTYNWDRVTGEGTAAKVKFRKDFG